jgi:FkbM family methyltransferase
MLTRTDECRHGIFTYHYECRFLGTSLRLYGEWSEEEVLMYDAFLKPTDVSIEVGANIGALTVPLSRRCKKVFAFEPQPENYELLCMNLIRNETTNVDYHPWAIGAKDGITFIPALSEVDEEHGVVGDYGGAEIGSGSNVVELHTLDNMSIIDSQIDFIKMDCEGSELDVLIGGRELITKDCPLLYIENNRPSKSDALIGWLVDHGYECYWHRPQVYREDNFRNCGSNIFGNCDSPNMICIKDLSKYKHCASWLKERVV